MAPSFLIWSLVLFAIPLEAVWKLKNNTYVVDVDMSRTQRPSQTVVLKCEESEKQINSKVHWKKSSNYAKTNTETQVIVGSGTEHRVHIKDFPDGGNYTCWNEKQEVLYYSVLLINEIVDIRGANSKQILKEYSDTKTFLYCEAKMYSGNFTCYWQITTRGKTSQEEMFVVPAEGGVRNVVCSHPSLDHNRSVYSTNCQELGVCLHGEEHQGITLVLHAIHGKRYENVTTSFFIRDIVKPDPPLNLSISSIGQKSVTLRWEYPKSWNMQKTFFPLTFQVKVEESRKVQNRITLNPEGGRRKRVQYYQVEGTSLTLDQWNSEKTYYVQARDRYGASSWSNWSTYERSM